MRLPKSLKSRQDFRRIRTNGRRGRSDGIVVFALPSQETRLGLAVRKGGGGAVVRNRARRRVREAFRAQEVRGLDVVVAAEEEAATVDFQELVADLERALLAAGTRGRLGDREEEGRRPARRSRRGKR